MGLPFGQAEVDFVIPDIEQDVPLCIDPFLLYKSRDPGLRDLHKSVVTVFNEGIRRFQAGDERGLNELIRFPEAKEIGFGYSKTGTGGRGLGDKLNAILAEALVAAGELVDRGFSHVEELQLLVLGVGPDLTSDITANLIKTYLAQYTLTQAEQWSIPVSSHVPLRHAFDHSTFEWRDEYVDLPTNPLSGGPLLLVPRRMVRLLPGINYEDYRKTDAARFLPAGNRQIGMAGRAKPEIVAATRKQLAVLDRYVDRKERTASGAIPALGESRASEAEIASTASRLKRRLRELPAGRADAASYHDLVLEVMNFLFAPDLTDGEKEVRTVDGTDRRDLIFTNEGEASFLRYIRDSYGLLLLIECKNTASLEAKDLNQTAAYLGARIGHLGFVTTRSSASDAVLRKSYSIFNDTSSSPRKVIIVLSDEDLLSGLRMRVEGMDPGSSCSVGTATFALPASSVPAAGYRSCIRRPESTTPPNRVRLIGSTADACSQAASTICAYFGSDSFSFV